MARVVMGLRYSGHDFEGWQTQPHGRTIQDHLSKAVHAITGETFVVHCAGRTDAGVHAREQVVHFDSSVSRPLSAWIKGVNNFLPSSIVVVGVAITNDVFHARFSALSRTYRYFFYTASVRDPFKTHMTWLHYPLNLEAMLQASKVLLGTHDFTSFRAAQCQSKTPVRTIHSIDMVRCEDYAYFEIRGNAFLHHMVRNIMGALFEVGLGKKSYEWMADILTARNRSLAAKTASAKGLSLWHVEYPEHFGIRQLFESTELRFTER
jgi:tRNA pseudouridine38-40 synthase